MSASFADQKALSDLIWWENIANRIAAMRAVHHESPLWPLFVDRWDEVIELIDRECPGAIVGYSANLRSTDTYRLVRSLIEEKS